MLFDRSGCNRAGVERVMGFCSNAAYGGFMRQTPEYGRHLVRGGERWFKFWFSVGRADQRRRFQDRPLHRLNHAS